MSSSEQPKDHCKHEFVCIFFRHDSRIAWKDGTRCMANQEGCKICNEDTRPHPTPTDEQCRICSQATERKAREHVLNAVLDGNAKRFCPSIDDTHYHCCDVEACIREIFKNYEESLRAQQQGGVSES